MTVKRKIGGCARDGSIGALRGRGHRVFLKTSETSTGVKMCRPYHTKSPAPNSDSLFTIAVSHEPDSLNQLRLL